MIAAGWLLTRYKAELAEYLYLFRHVLFNWTGMLKVKWGDVITTVKSGVIRSLTYFPLAGGRYR